MVNGHEIKYGLWPWQAGLYHLLHGKWSFWCGGSLINEYAVITGQWNSRILFILEFMIFFILDKLALHLEQNKENVQKHSHNHR